LTYFDKKIEDDMLYKGKIHKFGDDVNTDEILPARYLNTTDKAELAKHCMEDADKEFSGKVKPGEIMAAGKNFGCGSSREHAPVAIKASGVSCVVAESFARIFARNSINIGLPIVESKEAAKDIKAGDTVSIDTDKGVIKNITSKKTYKFEKYPPFMQKIIKAGGLMASIAGKK
jgi:3-isopropylmalate/(R)-2-methylmalate dehydratase small subunit